MKQKFGLLLAFMVLLAFALQANAQLNIQAIDVAGDSISKGFNAASRAPCSNADQEEYNWITGKSPATNFCQVGPENVFSLTERLECEYRSQIFVPLANSARSGADMLSDFLLQASNIKAFLSSQPGQRLAAVLLGHNDNCGGTINKTNAACSNPDLDPNNYCRTRPASFEREFRRGLEVLMTVPNTRIGVAAPVRVSQLCNFQTKQNCQAPVSCQIVWSSLNICQSLTRPCTPERIADAYLTMKAYRDILMDVTAEYAAIADGGASRTVTVGGATIGGGVKAAGTHFVYSDAAWQFRFNTDQLSCCDCFHPSDIGQNKLAQMMKNGLSCSRINPCCKETGDPLVDGQCGRTEQKRIYYNGLF